MPSDTRLKGGTLKLDAYVYNKKIESTKPNKTTSQNDKVPVWFNQEITKEAMSADELEELEKQLSEFR